MTVRAMWKGVVEFGPVSVPVKLYPAIADKSVSFRLLNRQDGKPVRQVLVNPKTKAIVEHEETERGFVTGKGELVSLDSAELESLEPEASRVIEVRSFLPPGSIEYRWYVRPYYLGPDGDEDAYFTLVAALGRDDLEGVAHWVMRDKEYVGSLRLHRGY
ncbi:MAG TPA: Ku protein, partial [Trueperaceae bacterium]|nr:Ku protein [Trueperaceae bacterium]